jgi:hypothetical protein
MCTAPNSRKMGLTRRKKTVSQNVAAYRSFSLRCQTVRIKKKTVTANNALTVSRCGVQDNESGDRQKDRQIDSLVTDS